VTGSQVIPTWLRHGGPPNWRAAVVITFDPTYSHLAR
jgi:hypothetical protein